MNSVQYPKTPDSKSGSLPYEAFGSANGQIGSLAEAAKAKEGICLKSLKSGVRGV